MINGEKIAPKPLNESVNRCKSVLKKHKNIVFSALSIFLILLLISIFTITSAYDIVTVEAHDEDLPGCLNFGYDTSIDDHGNVTFTPQNGDPYIYIYSSSESDYNAITVSFAEPVTGIQDMQVYFSYNGEPFEEKNSAISPIANDGLSSTVTLNRKHPYKIIRIDINGTFTLDKITFETKNYHGLTRVLNPISSVSLIVAIALLIIFEKKIHYFKWIKENLKQVYLSTLALASRKTVAAFVTRLLLLLSSCALAVSYILILMLAVMTTGIMVYMFFLSVFFVIALITDRILANKINAPSLFLIITLICGFLIATLLPISVSSNWDEEYHYARCLDIKNLFFSSEKSDADIYQEQRTFELTTEAYLKNPQEMIATLLVKDTFKHYQSPRIMNYYQLIGHAPGGITMIFSDIVGLNYFATYILAKMANVAVYAFVIFLGISKLKSGALIFSSICMMPTALFLASTYSYDYFITAFMAYSYAYFISELQRPEKKLSKMDVVLMFGALLLACMPKAVYCFLIIPMLFMPKGKFESGSQRKRYILSGFAVAFISIVSFLLPMLLDSSSASDIRGGADVSASGQIAYILNNPFEYAKTLLKFLGFYVSFTNASNFAVSFSYVGAASGIYGTLAICIMAFTAFTDKSEHDNFACSLKVKSVTLLTAFVQTAIVASALYISFTPVGHNGINGCQWRYIIPILLPSLYCVGSSKVTHTIDKRFLYGLVFGALALNAFASFFTVYIKGIIF